VPTLALLALFVAYLGIGFTNVLVVLILLAIPPMLTNAYVGVRQVERDTVDAARGMGMTDLEIIRKVELPLALPLIFGGLRLAAVAVVATATIGPLADVDTLGKPIINVNVYGDAGQIAAAIVVTLVTLITDAGLGALQRAVTPKGLKVGAGEPAHHRLSLPSLRRGAPT
jgi:osmoprotectant transport system permease protein